MQVFLLGVGILFTLKLGFLQITKVGKLIKTIMPSKKKTAGVSPFSAFATALGGSLGIGNIAGVAAALSLGGAGAVFWMWVSAFFGMMTKYAEVVLAVAYREKRDGENVGGPMYYMKKGLGSNFLANSFAWLALFGSFGIGNIAQVNSVSVSMFDAFSVPRSLTGIVIAVVSAMVIYGGTKRITGLLEKIVPLITVFYMAAACLIMFMYRAVLGDVMREIIHCAFAPSAAAGGFAGATVAQAIRQGMSRGVFSNEAGLGSTPIAYAAADEENPVKQGMWGIFEVFVDTIVMCSATAFVILATGAHREGSEGILIAIRAFGAVLGDFSGAFISISVLFFAFASMLAWCYYGQVCAKFLGRGPALFYRPLFIGVMYMGAVMDLNAAWGVSDILNGLMIIPNVIGILCLSGMVVKITKNNINRI